MLISSSQRDSLLKSIDGFMWEVATFFSGFIPKAKSPNSSKVAIIRPGGLGDLVVLTLALQKLGTHQSEFRFFIQKRSEPWAKFLDLDYVIVDENPFGVFRHFGRHKNVINTEQFFGLATALATGLCGRGGKIFGFSTNRGAKYFSGRTRYDFKGTHEIKMFSDLLNLAITQQPTKPDFNIYTQRVAPVKDYICISLSGLDSVSRRLDLGSWEKLLFALNPSAEIRILASPSERSFGKKLKERLTKVRSVELEVGNFADQVKVLQNAKELISIDGGMVHVASFLGVPVKAIFTSGQFYKWAPISEGSEILKRSDLKCQPCTVFGQTPPCRNRLKCLVVDEILKQRSR